MMNMNMKNVLKIAHQSPLHVDSLPTDLISLEKLCFARQPPVIVRPVTITPDDKRRPDKVPTNFEIAIYCPEHPKPEGYAFMEDGF